jgi:hypothetical protein
MNEKTFFMNMISLHGFKKRYLVANLGRSKFGVDSCLISFNAYDVNGYRFHTTSYEKSRPNPRTTNTRVFTSGVVKEHEEPEDYCGIVEEYTSSNSMVKMNLSQSYSNASCLIPEYQKGPLNLG